MKSKKNKSTSFRHDHYSQNREKIKKRGGEKKNCRLPRKASA